VKLSDVMSAAGLSSWAEAALVIFLVVFLSLAIRLLRHRSASFDEHAALPLADDDTRGAHSTPSRSGDQA
jgi:cbb3-type cytochrome oxidase subunit 3